MNDEQGKTERLGPQLSDELKQFAADLSRLRPRDNRLDRERLAFLAGQASVASRPAQPLKVLGLPLESRVWPAAFASMSAIAAALFVVLLMRPESPSVQPTAASDRVPRAHDQVQDQPFIGRDVLMTRDVHLSDIQSRLAKRDPGKTDGDMSLPLPHERDVPILTPNAWHQVINNTKSASPSADDSSSLFQTRGATL
jgi:hypothetical protein